LNVILKAIFSILLIVAYGVSFAQLGGSPEKSALKNIERHRWQKAEMKLRKSLARDTLNPSVRYALSVLYFHPGNPAFDIDSAYRYSVTALEDYTRSPHRERERIRRLGIDSLGLIAQRAKIDSAAFEVARRTNTEAAYLEFLSHFPTATQRELAAQLRDEVAFQDALRENTFQSFYRYLERYPQAQRAPEARAHYHRLLYLTSTKDQRLSSYEKFLSEHPETPYRGEVYRHIFEISTADGSVESFLSFMSRYPVSGLVTKASQIIFHILADDEDPRWPERLLNDSLQNLLEINRTFLVPFLKNDRYGFMDQKGFEIIEPAFRSIHPDYLCGLVTDEMLIVDNQLIARDGHAVYHGAISALTDLGIGFLKVTTDHDVKVIHKAGFVFADSVEDARILNKAFIALKKKNAWFLYTLTGRLLDARPWRDITAFGEVIVFTGEKQKFMVSRHAAGRSADARLLQLSEPFQDVKLWPNELIWGKAGDFEGVLDQSLQGVIRFDKQRLTQTTFGAVASATKGFVIYNWEGKRSPTFERVNILGKHVGVRKNNKWYIFNPVEQQMKGMGYDSLRAEGAFVVGLREDSVYIHFEEGAVRSFFRPQKVWFVPGLDSTSFLSVHGHGPEKVVFDLKGRELFTAAFDAIEYAGKGLFVVVRKEKKGLLNIRGETVLPPDFDAIGSAKENVISVLKNKKFGAYHVEKKKLIKPQYDRNLLPYTAALLITFRDGHYGFLGWDNKPLSAFEFEEIGFWNDSVAMVKKEGLWNLYDVNARKITAGNLRSINVIRNSGQEKLAIIQKENNYGVIDNRGTTVIPPTFSDIVNLGSPEVPLYFTEKHIPEASLHIVIYYDGTGEMLRKEIYDDAADYDKIYCSDQ
jgi:hypothetical protein